MLDKIFLGVIASSMAVLFIGLAVMYLQIWHFIQQKVILAKPEERKFKGGLKNHEI